MPAALAAGGSKRLREPELMAQIPAGTPLAPGSLKAPISSSLIKSQACTCMHEVQLCASRSRACESFSSTGATRLSRRPSLHATQCSGCKTQEEHCGGEKIAGAASIASCPVQLPPSSISDLLSQRISARMKMQKRTLHHFLLDLRTMQGINGGGNICVMGNNAQGWLGSGRTRQDGSDRALRPLTAGMDWCPAALGAGGAGRCQAGGSHSTLLPSEPISFSRQPSVVQTLLPVPLGCAFLFEMGHKNVQIPIEKSCKSDHSHSAALHNLCVGGLF